MVISTNLSNIGIGTFWYCTSLSSVTIPNSVTSIGEEAFGYCTNLTSITIPENVINVGEMVFQNCGSLTSVYFQGNAPTADSSVFVDSSKANGYDPATVYYLPGTSGWSSTFGGVPAVMLRPPVPAGSLQVTINPSEVNSEGAEWQVDGGTAQTSGATVLGLSVGATQ